MKRSILLGLVSCIVLTLSQNIIAQDIFLSAENGDIETVKALLKKDAMAVNAQNDDGDTPLHIAVLNGQIDMVEFLLAQNPDLEIKNEKGFTPLLCASWIFHRESGINYRRIIELLLAYGAEANVTGNGGYNPLHWINHPSENSLADILELNALFIGEGVDLDAQNTYGSTPLHYAVHIHPKVAQTLIEHNADVNIKDKQGRTPLFRISGFDHPEAANTVRLLINNGALVNIPDNNGITAIERALANGRKDIADILISYQDKSDIGKFPMLTGPYLGQKSPGMVPEIFAPGIVSTGYDERTAAFTPDGKELYYVLWGAPHGVILCMKEVNGRWTRPEVAPFSGRYQGDFTMSGDGNRIVFSSNGPFSGDGKPMDQHYSWIVERTENGWGNPHPFGSAINSLESFAGCPTIADNGNLYFFSDRAGSLGSEDIWMSLFVNGKYEEPRNLGNSINTEDYELDPFISPDESYLIFTRIDKKRERGADLFIAFRRADGTWTEAVNMGEGINSGDMEYCPTVSADGKYFFFTSSRKLYRTYSEIPLSYEKKLEILNSPGNGSADIYWVDAKIIEDLKPEELKQRMK